MQLLIQIKFGRLRVNLAMDSFLTNDNFVERSIVNVYDIKANTEYR